MAIKGSLAEASLADVLQLLAMGRKTGCLSLSHGTNFGYIFFDAGRITYASIVNRRDRIGERLVQSGAITREVLQEMVEEQAAQPGVRLGDLLVARGLVTRDELDEHVCVQVEETVYILYTWHDGAFNFEPDVRSPHQENRVSINPESLLLEGARRIDEWALIEKSIPSLDVVFDVDRRALESAEASVTPEQRHVLAYVDGKRDVTGVAEDSGQAEFDVGKLLHELLVAGIVRHVGRSTATELHAVTSVRVDEHRNLGVAFYRASMLDEATREFRRVLELSPDDGQARWYVALMHMRQARWEEAAESFEAMASLATATAAATHNLGLALERLGRYAEARAAFERATQLPDGDCARVHTSLGAVCLLLGDTEAGERALVRARSLWKRRPAASWYHYAALAAAWLGDAPRAEALLEEGITHYPRSGVLLNNLAALLELRGAFAEALAAAQRGLAQEAALPQLHKNVGDLYYRAGRHDEAYAAFQRVVSAEPQHGSDVYLKLGNILLKRQQRAEALDCWRRALEIDPNNAIVRSNLSALGGLSP